MTDEVAEIYTRHSDVDIGPRGIATGGTTFGTALALAAARAVLEHVLTPSAYTHVRSLGSRLSDGLETEFAKRGLPWRAFRAGPRSGYCLFPQLPRNGAEAARSLDVDLIDARRVYMANRGIWDSVMSAGPQAALAHTEEHIARYVQTAGQFLDAIL